MMNRTAAGIFGIIMAAQLCLPISAWINLCDREPERENDVMKLIERHIQQFFEVYQVK